MTTHYSTCLLCQNHLPAQGLHLGNLPPCNRFEMEKQSSSPSFPLRMQECPACGLIQLINPPPLEALTPRVSWIRYNEPDTHLDYVSTHLQQYLENGARVSGLGPFDQPLFKHLETQGMQCEALTLLPETKKQNHLFPYLESIQACYQTDRLQSLAQEKGQSDLLVCRYLLEHCRDPLEALQSFRSLIKDHGYALIEVPDSSKFLASKDYSFIWEEHVCYFTEESLSHLLRQSGYKIVEMLRFEGQLEDALVAIVQPQTLFALNQGVEKSRATSLFGPYAGSFDETRAAYQESLSAIKSRGGKIAIFGAGHQAMMFINALQLQGYIDYVLDDDANKQGYFTPGSRVPIMPSAQLLLDANIDTCLLAVSPRVEGKIREKCAAFLERGGKMYSIFPGSHMDSLLETAVCA